MGGVDWVVRFLAASCSDCCLVGGVGLGADADRDRPIVSGVGEGTAGLPNQALKPLHILSRILGRALSGITERDCRSQAKAEI